MYCRNDSVTWEDCCCGCPSASDTLVAADRLILTEGLMVATMLSGDTLTLTSSS